MKQSAKPVRYNRKRRKVDIIEPEWLLLKMQADEEMKEEPNQKKDEGFKDVQDKLKLASKQIGQRKD